MPAESFNRPDHEKGIWQFQEAKAKLSKVLNITD